MNTEKPNCMKCRKFFITWEQPHPYGCKAYGFKSKEHPSQVVANISGMQCQLFQEKEKSNN